jgi:hypothetical protein
MSFIVAPETSDFHLTGYAETSINIETGYTRDAGYASVGKGGGGMFPALGRELSKIRVESLQGDGSPRPAKSPGRLRRVLGLGFVGAGERLLGECGDPHAVRIGEGA